MRIGFPANPNYGTIAKCPWCDATDIPKKGKGQVTCGREGCRVKQLKYRLRVRAGTQYLGPHPDHGTT